MNAIRSTLRRMMNWLMPPLPEEATREGHPEASLWLDHASMPGMVDLYWYRV